MLYAFRILLRSGAKRTGKYLFFLWGEESRIKNAVGEERTKMGGGGGLIVGPLKSS